MKISLFQYLLEANVLLVLLWAYFKLFLARGKQFRFNRIYLLGSLAVGFGFPLLPVPFENRVETALQFSYTLPEAIVGSADTVDAGFVLNWTHVYLFIAASCTLLFLGRAFFLLRTALRHPVQRKNGYYQVECPGLGPASFGPFLFWDSQLDRQEGNDIIRAHEIAHIQLWHSLDVSLYRLAIAFFWFNPVMYLLYRELRQVHEFQADATALRMLQAPRKRLQKLILAHQLKVETLPLSNHFSSHTKNRIDMLNKSQTPLKSLAAIMVLPLLAGLFMLVGVSNLHAQKDGQINVTPTEEVTEKPTPTNLMDVLTKIEYPASAKSAGIEQKVMVRVLVNKKGAVESYEYLNGDEIFHAAIDKKITKLKFSPGRVNGKAVNTKMVVPIVFKL